MITGSVYRKPVAIFAGVIGVVQSLLWFSMAMTAIAGYFCAKLDYQHSDKLLAVVFYNQYFRDPSCKNAAKFKEITSQLTIFIWMMLYLAFSLMWLVASIVLISGFTVDKLKQKGEAFIYFWSSVTICIAIMDVALATFFGVDYETLSKYEGDLPLVMQTVSGTMMAIAMRGFVLWLLNVACAIYLPYDVRINRIKKLRLKGSTSLYDNVIIPDDDSLQRRSLKSWHGKGLPRTYTPSTMGSATLAELMNRYAVHTSATTQSSKTRGTIIPNVQTQKSEGRTPPIPPKMPPSKLNDTSSRF